jgi:epoxyqueuosine reductase
MITAQTLTEGATERHLCLVGILDVSNDPDTPTLSNRLALLGPAPDSFWPAFRRSDEARDGKADPIDRWSRRVIGTWACDLKGKALFPFGGPPYRPFLRWAIDSGRAWASPVGPLVHDSFGLMVSYRGAIALEQTFELPTVGSSPCASCDARPCLSACPVGALGTGDYKVPVCKSHISSDAGTDCLSAGCQVRRACPISLGAGRDLAQSAYHMTLFLGA